MSQEHRGPMNANEPSPPTNTPWARCSCGRVELELQGAPITGAVCYCDDCQAGSRQIEGLPGGQPSQEADGGTAYLLYRKDRFRCTRGSPLLKDYKLREASPTNRVVATCCGSAMFLRFDGGEHWVSVFRARLQGEPPALRMRINIRSRPPGPALPEDLPAYPTVPPRFILKLMAAWLAMGLQRLAPAVA